MTKNKKEDLRLYCLNQFYMSGIRNGIQALHSSNELLRKYDFSNHLQPLKHRQLVVEWADNHKTVVVLNGGDSQNMGKLRGILESPKNLYPFAAFKESGMSNLLTSMCIVLPEKIFDKDNREFIQKNYRYEKESLKYVKIPRSLMLVSEYDEDHLKDYTEWEINFILEMSKCPMAS